MSFKPKLPILTDTAKAGYVSDIAEITLGNDGEDYLEIDLSISNFNYINQGTGVFRVDEPINGNGICIVMFDVEVLGNKSGEITMGTGVTAISPMYPFVGLNVLEIIKFGTAKTYVSLSGADEYNVK